MSGGSSSSSKNACPALASFFERHLADIVCLQEHKIPKPQLANRTEPRQLSHVPGYESFWSCCVDDSSRGMNGVCTYARTGSVVRADPAPLAAALNGDGGGDGNGDGENDSCWLNRQGRCVKTDHGTFVLFNVYVPASGGQPLRNKMKFLNALRRAMQGSRRAGRSGGRLEHHAPAVGRVLVRPRRVRERRDKRG
jgi:exonuclease III